MELKGVQLETMGSVRGKVTEVRKVIADNYSINSVFCDNKISNTKYTPYNFIFKNLFEQFGRFMNFYFLLIACLQLWSIITPVNPVSTWGPLFIIFTISLIKEGIDDYLRFSRDRAANTRLVIVCRGGQEREVLSEEVIVGDIIKIHEDEEICCDLALLYSSDRDGLAYIQTANLDGETDLKTRTALPDFQHMNIDEVKSFHGVIECAVPNPEVYKFDSRMKKDADAHEWYSLSASQLLLQSTNLRNTEFVYGVAVYTGNETKMGMNKRTPPTKWTWADKTINRITMAIFTFQLSLTIAFGAAGTHWSTNSFNADWYQEYALSPKEFYDPLVIPLRFLLLMSLMIPISLKVTLDIAKYFYAMFIGWDMRMWDPERKMFAVSNNTSISEDLGQIEYIFTDKTGTLTENIMTFKKCTIAGVMYGEAVRDPDAPPPPKTSAVKAVRREGPAGQAAQQKNHENASTPGSGGDKKTPTPKSSMQQSIDPFSTGADGSPREIEDALSDYNLYQQIQEGDPDVTEFFRCLAICHTVIAIHKGTDIIYKASSPDEEALVKAAAAFGYMFFRKEANSFEICIHGCIEVYELLQILEFSSERKRMSVIVRNLHTGKIILYCKGADDVIFKRASSALDKKMTSEQLERFAQMGLRTLCIAKRVIPQEEFCIWSETFKTANTSLNSRNDKLAEAYDQIEKNLAVLGTTAIEDKLQVEVPETIHLLRQAGLVFWMLTGDKFSTAVQIALSCNLISSEENLLRIAGQDGESVGECMRDFMKRAEELPAGKSISVIVEGQILGLALEHHHADFLALCMRASAVICCRVTPQQKALVVRLVKDNNHMALAIGDGGNDVSMIQEAHIGVGIAGREGLQAARAADYQIGKFRYLKRLMLVHGRYSYLRTCFIAQYSFYKSIAFASMQLFYAFQSAFSGVSFFNTFAVTAYNILFTGLPIFCYVLDKDVSEEGVFQHPVLYEDGRTGRYLNFRTFFPWFFRAWLHATIIFSFSMGTYSAAWTHQANGYPIDYQAISTPAYTALVLTVALTLAYDTHNFTRVHHVIYWGIILLYFIASLIYSHVPAFDYYYVFDFILQDGSFWLYNVVCVFVTLTLINIIKYFGLNHFPTERERVMMKEYLQREGMATDHIDLNVAEEAPSLLQEEEDVMIVKFDRRRY